ncbi:Protein MAIN-LIKE 1 [Glycine max]|nr:Protein MAIN-LIKE 1 [Glycine max]
MVMILTVLPSTEGRPHRHAGDEYLSLLPMMCLRYLWTRQRIKFFDRVFSRHRRSSFIERWHWETSTFHLLVGEVSITLDDVASLLHLPIIGDFHDFHQRYPSCWTTIIGDFHLLVGEVSITLDDEAMLKLVELLMVSPEVAMVETGHCCGLYSETHVHVVHLDALRDLTQTRRYAWGAVGLVYMYDHLNDASISTNRQVGGYITLLQCWIYEHFPSVAECNADPDYDEVSSCACRWIATKKTVKKISIATYRQRLDRLRIPDFGYVQCIPAHPVDSWVSFDDIDDRWVHYSDHLAPAGDICIVPEACHAIAKTLEHHPSLNEVMPGTLTHEVIQKCLRIARGVTEDRNMHAGSRRRRRTDQP